MGKILIKNGKIWDGSKFLYGDILTEDKHIVEIAPQISADATFTYDAQGLLVTPGLIDLHTHLKGVSCDKYGIAAESCCFPFGVTAAVDAGAELGDRAYLESLNVKNVVLVCTTIRENKAKLDRIPELLQRYGDRAVGLKAYFSTPHATDLSPLKEIFDYAHSLNLPLMVHCNGAPVPMAEFLELFKAGDILTHPFHGGKNNAAEDGYESLRKAQQRGVIIDAGFAGHVHTSFEVFRGAVEAGVQPDTISTDITRSSAFMRGGRYGMTMALSYARCAGMTEEDILKAVTTTPAKILGKPWGKLEVGGVADIAVLEYGNEGFYIPKQDIESKTGYRCRLTMADGDIVHREF